jgi:hypothetical protein
MDENGQLSPLEEYALQKQLEAQRARGLYTDKAKASLEQPKSSWDQVAAQAILNIAPILVGAGINGREGAHAGSQAAMVGSEAYNTGIQEENKRQSLMNQLEAQEAMSAFRTAENDADWATKQTLRAQERDMEQMAPISAFEADQMKSILQEAGIEDVPDITNRKQLEEAKEMLKLVSARNVDKNRQLGIDAKQKKADKEGEREAFLQELRGPQAAPSPEGAKTPDTPLAKLDALMARTDLHKEPSKKMLEQQAEIDAALNQANRLLDDIEGFYGDQIDTRYREDPIFGGERPDDATEGPAALNAGLNKIKGELEQKDPGRLKKLAGILSSIAGREAGRKTGTGTAALLSAQADLIAKMITKAIEGARPSDYDAVTYKAIVRGEVLSSPEMMYRFIAQTKNVMEAGQIAKNVSYQARSFGLQVDSRTISDYAKEQLRRRSASYATDTGEVEVPLTPTSSPQAQAIPTPAANPQDPFQKSAIEQGEPVVRRSRQARRRDGSVVTVYEVVAPDGSEFIVMDGKMYGFDGRPLGGQ